MSFVPSRRRMTSRPRIDHRWKAPRRPWRGAGALQVDLNAALEAAKAKGKQLGNYQHIAAAKQLATAECAEAVRLAIAETAYLSARAAAGRAEPSRRQDRERKALAPDADHSHARSPRPLKGVCAIEDQICDSVVEKRYALGRIMDKVVCSASTKEYLRVLD
jgi:hypothetical protein